MVQISEEQLYNSLVFLILGVIVFIGFFIFIIYRIYKNNLKAQTAIFNAVLNTQESERLRIARDLHDDIGSTLSGIKINANTILKTVTNNDVAHTNVLRLIGIVDSAMPGLKQTVRKLAPHKLHENGLVSELNNLQDVFFKIGVHFTVTTNAETIKLSEDAELHIFRIVQELTNNAMKYSQAKNVEISLLHENKNYQIIYIDNGVGFDINDNKFVAGLGLKNIKARTQILGGTYIVKSTVNVGTDWIITLPLKQIQIL